MICVVGIGPGDKRLRTFAAQAALENCNVLAGYSAYVDLLKDEFPGKTIIETGMRGEIERCEQAIAASRVGKTVTMVCSGDAAVYGMASLLIELADDRDELEIIPGVTAALAASGKLGAPISGDFAAVSLSDLLTPWEVIENRLRCAVQGDFVIALYNPSSRKRTGTLRRACEIALEVRKGDTPCGWIQNIGRAGEHAKRLTLSELKDEVVDMVTTVIIGNSQTRAKGVALVTPRGYRL